MLVPTPFIGRRHVVLGLSAAAGSLMLPARRLFAQEGLVPTPRQTTGPFYPVDWRGDIDNDLVVVKGEAAKAMGQVVIVEGKVIGVDAQPLAGAAVEIWQCDAQGVYRHPADEGGGRRRDEAFQGRGRTLSDADGRYRFRTIRPVPYGWRTPHIHFSVEPPDRQRLITQMYVHGEPLNQRDGLLNAIADRRQRESVIVRLEPAERIEPGALRGEFDIVIA